MAKRYLGGGISFEQKDVYQEFSEDEGGGGGGSTTLAGLTDVDISNPTDGQTLVYNATSGKWENGAGGGDGGIYCIDASVVPSSVTIGDVEYTEIYLDAYVDPLPFYIIPAAVILDAKAFYLKGTDGDGVFTYFPYKSDYFPCGPIQDDPTSVNPSVLTVSSSVFVCKTELGDVVYFIPDTAEFKTVKLPL